MSNYNQADFYFKRGETLYKNYEYDKSIEFYSKVVDLSSQETNIRDAFLVKSLIQRAFANWHLGNDSEGIEDCSKIIEFTPNNPYAWALRGLCHGRLGNSFQAVEDLKIGFEIAPEDIWILKQFINFYLKIYNYHAALPYAKRLKELRPKHVESLFILGKIYLRLGDADNAFAIYSYAHGLIGYGDFQTNEDLQGMEDVWVNGGLGGVYRLRKDLKTALFYLDMACHEYCDVAWVWAERGYVYLAQENYTKALSDFQKALSLDNSLGELKFEIMECEEKSSTSNIK